MHMQNHTHRKREMHFLRVDAELFTFAPRLNCKLECFQTTHIQMTKKNIVSGMQS